MEVTVSGKWRWSKYCEGTYIADELAHQTLLQRLRYWLRRYW